jgi:protoporphyrinogen oxidase
VIIGAGLAGLSAAHALRDREVVILERETRAGGRVLTFNHATASVDMGACFAVLPLVLPPGTNEQASGRLIPERGPISIYYQSRLFTGSTSWDCIEAMPWDSACREALAAFRDGRIPPEALPDEALRVINAFFKQIHPGDIRDYIPQRQRDALDPLYPDHFEKGNGCAVEAHLGALGDRVQLALGRVALELKEDRDGVTVIHRTADLEQEGRIDCRAVIVATPANIARTLVRPSHPSCTAFLESVRYGTYTVVALVLDAPRLAPFRYFVTPESPLNVIIQQGSADRRYRTLLCYYSDPLAQAAAELSDTDLVETTLQKIGLFGFGTFDQSHVTFSAVKRWGLVGTILTPGYARLKSRDNWQATDRIFLAGDYLSTDENWGYGTRDAVTSGRATASLVREKFGY